MDGETTSQILEGLARADAAARAEGEKAEYDAAAAEAARDLYDDYGESPAQRTPMQELEDEDTRQSVEHVSKLDSLETTLHGANIRKLSSSPAELDSLIGASSALEMADGDTEYLKRYSERVAMEADQSDQTHRDEQDRQEALRQARIRQT